MKENNSPGLFVVFEGLDGSGEKEQAETLASILTREGYRVHLCKEPTNNLIGGIIKARLAGEWQSTPEGIQLLFASDRAQHLAYEIMPHLEAGHIVICDRYIMSSVAYGSLEVKDVKWLEEINSQFLRPDLTFLVNVRPKICAIRTKQSQYSLELYREEKKFEIIWKQYEELSKKYKNIYVIDGERDEIEVTKEILDITNKVLKTIQSKKE